MARAKFTWLYLNDGTRQSIVKTLIIVIYKYFNNINKLIKFYINYINCINI